MKPVCPKCKGTGSEGFTTIVCCRSCDGEGVDTGADHVHCESFLRFDDETREKIVQILKFYHPYVLNEPFESVYRHHDGIRYDFIMTDCDAITKWELKET